MLDIPIKIIKGSSDVFAEYLRKTVNSASKSVFNNHISDLYKKTGRKISALASVASFMNFDKKILLMRAFFTSHFSYCPLIWICHSCKIYRKIKMLHERCRRLYIMTNNGRSMNR